MLLFYAVGSLFCDVRCLRKISSRKKFFKKCFQLFLSLHIIHAHNTHTHTHTHTHIVVVVILLLLLLIIIIIIIMAPRTPSSVHPLERAVRKVELSKFHLEFQAEMRTTGV